MAMFPLDSCLGHKLLCKISRYCAFLGLSMDLCMANSYVVQASADQHQVVRHVQRQPAVTSSGLRRSGGGGMRFALNAAENDGGHSYGHDGLLFSKILRSEGGGSNDDYSMKLGGRTLVDGVANGSRLSSVGPPEDIFSKQATASDRDATSSFLSMVMDARSLLSKHGKTSGEDANCFCFHEEVDFDDEGEAYESLEACARDCPLVCASEDKYRIGLSDEVHAGMQTVSYCNDKLKCECLDYFDSVKEAGNNWNRYHHSAPVKFSGACPVLECYHGCKQYCDHKFGCVWPVMASTHCGSARSFRLSLLSLFFSFSVSLLFSFPHSYRLVDMAQD